jgi:hypothetical protein
MVKKMTKVRKAVSRIVGGIQCGLGGLMSILAYLVYASSQIQNVLGITSDEVYFYMFLFLVFGVFSIVSGLLLIQEKNCEG